MDVKHQVYLLTKEESLGLGFELRQSWNSSQTGRQRVPDRWSDEAERVLTNRFQITSVSFSRLRTGGCVKFDTCSAHQQILNYVSFGVLKASRV